MDSETSEIVEIEIVQPEEKKGGGRPREWVTEDEVHEAWNYIISGETETSVLFRFRKERNIKEKALLEALNDFAGKLSVKDSDDERVKIIEAARLMVNSLAKKLNESNQRVLELDAEIATVDKKDREGKEFYLGLHRVRQAELVIIGKLSTEIRNYNLHLAELTGAKKAARRIKGEKKVGKEVDNFTDMSTEELEEAAKGKNA